MCVFAPQTSATTTWDIQTVAAAPTGPGSLVFDSADNPHIAYYTNRRDNMDTLRYATWTGIQWNIVDVDIIGAAGWQPELKLDSNGYPHICYYSQVKDSSGRSESAVKYASWDGNTWQITKMSDRAVGCALDLDSYDKPHIVLQNQDSTGSNLRYYSLTEMGWQEEKIVPSDCLLPALVIDSNDKPHVFFTPHNLTLIYATKQGETWTTETLDYNANYSPKVVLDDNDRPHVSYSVKPDSTGSYYLRYTYWNGENWDYNTIANIGSRGISSAIALDSRGDPRIVCGVTNGLKSFSWTGSEWIDTMIDETLTSGYSGLSLALDSLDYAHVSYVDSNTRATNYASEVSQSFSFKKACGGGKIALTDNGVEEKASFSFNVVFQQESSMLKGKLQFKDPIKGWTIESTDITTLVLSQDLTRALFSGLCTVNDEGSYSFTVYVVDNGEPGTDDVFKISLSNGYAATATLANGNIQVLSKA